MSENPTLSDEALIQRALRSARDTRFLSVRPAVRFDAAAVFASHFGSQSAVVIADENTFSAAGKDVYDNLGGARRAAATSFIFGQHVHADERCVNELHQAVAATDAIPVAVGSGTINDLTKLVAHRLARPYMVVATAASMDGYTAYGASITAGGSKQTFDCPAPLVVLADLEVIAAAPAELNASGYADLAAKMAAGADWIVADAAGAEPIDPPVWETVQGRLRDWIDAPAAIARGDVQRLGNLISGLMLSGFAMQAARSSRPASGAEHQFSHLWDMQHHTHYDSPPSHGFKVGIGTLASVALYEDLLAQDLSRLDVNEAIDLWPDLATLEQRTALLLGEGEWGAKAVEETRAKYPSAVELREQLTRVAGGWPQLKRRLAHQLIAFRDFQQMLRDAGCPAVPEQIGISRDQLRRSYQQALAIRRRFTVLDLAHRAGLLEESLGRLFGPGGVWAANAN
jgi:glycerol-1-phosphate dehydrogenase [NAD(P)+]